MPTFKYAARYASGEVAAGVIEALSQNDAVAALRKNFEVVLNIKEVPRTTGRTSVGRPKKIPTKSLALTCKQFSIILEAGLPLVQTVNLVAEQSEDKVTQKLLHQVADDVAGGWSLSYSLDQRAPYLPVTFRQTIRAGEESGDLVAAFERMSKYFEGVNKTRAKTITTISYPALIIVVAIVVISIVMGFAVPVFTQTFKSLGTELPGITKALIAVSDFFRTWIVLILFLLAAAVAGLFLFARTEKGGRALARFLLHVPVVGKIVRMSAASQFAHTMAALLDSGMPVTTALDVAGRTVDNKLIADEISRAMPGVEDGRSVGDSLSITAKEMPDMLVQMTKVGESAGSMEETLDVLATYYDNEVEVRTDRALALLEPIIIVCLSIFVVFILLAVYLPMFTMYGNV